LQLLNSCVRPHADAAAAVADSAAAVCSVAAADSFEVAACSSATAVDSFAVVVDSSAAAVDSFAVVACSSAAPAAQHSDSHSAPVFPHYYCSEPNDSSPEQASLHYYSVPVSPHSARASHHSY
jgi:hypothetical protein